jgi:putative PIN family toxin of toxin-antitoxin system
VPSATADTNVYISALQFGGVPRQLLEMARAGAVRLDISDAIMSEVLRVLKEKFDYPPEALQETEARLTSITRRVQPTETIEAIKSDPSDNRILECAAAAQSDYIVTGDKRHILPLGSHAGIPIVQVAEFFQQIQQQPGQER